MILVRPIETRSKPISPSGLRRGGGRSLGTMRLHSGEDKVPRPVLRITEPMRPDARPEPDRVVADAEAMLDRIDRQLQNLKRLLGEGFEGPPGPRAA